MYKLVHGLVAAPWQARSKLVLTRVSNRGASTSSAKYQILHPQKNYSLLSQLRSTPFSADLPLLAHMQSANCSHSWKISQLNSYTETIQTRHRNAYVDGLLIFTKWKCLYSTDRLNCHKNPLRRNGMATVRTAEIIIDAC